MARASTNADGRTQSPLIGERPIPIASYELRFHVGAYFRGQRRSGGRPGLPGRGADPLRHRRAGGAVPRPPPRHALELLDLSGQLIVEKGIRLARNPSRRRSEPALVDPHGNGRDRRHGQRRHLPAGPVGRGPGRARLAGRRHARRRAFSRHRRHGHDLCRPPGSRHGEAPGRVRFASRHAADRRQVRRRPRRARRPRGDAGAERRRNRDGGAPLPRQLDERGRRPLRPRHDRLGRVRGRDRQGLGARAHRSRRHPPR